MNKRDFDNLVDSVRQAGRIRRGEMKASRVVRRIPAAQQKRLDALMTKNSNGELTPAERKELRGLVARAEESPLKMHAP